jgi:hypothetical protein
VRVAGKLHHEEPLVIHSIVPDEVKISVSSYEKDLSTVNTVEANGSAETETAVPLSLTVSNFNFHPGTDSVRPYVDFSVRGMQNILVNNRESVGFLKLKLLDGNNGEVDHYQIKVMTPPSRVQSEQFTVAQYETNHPRIQDTFKTLRSLEHRLQLVQVLNVSNRSDFPVAFELPLEPQGSLSSNVQTTVVQQDRCAYTGFGTHLRQNLFIKSSYLVS